MARRYQALLLCVKAHQRQEIATIVGISRRTVQNWLHQAINHGLYSLAGREYGGGYPEKLSTEQKLVVDQWVTDGPTITLSRLQQRIAQQWRITLSLPQIPALLVKLDYRRIVSRKRHYQTDTDEQEPFKKQWPQKDDTNSS